MATRRSKIMVRPKVVASAPLDSTITKDSSTPSAPTLVTTTLPESQPQIPKVPAQPNDNNLPPSPNSSPPPSTKAKSSPNLTPSTQPEPSTPLSTPTPPSHVQGEPQSISPVPNPTLPSQRKPHRTAPSSNSVPSHPTSKSSGPATNLIPSTSEGMPVPRVEEATRTEAAAIVDPSQSTTAMVQESAMSQFPTEATNAGGRAKLFSPSKMTPILLPTLPQPTLVELTVEDELPESDIVNLISNIVGMDGTQGAAAAAQINSGEWWENLQTVGSPAPSSPDDILTLGQEEESFLPSSHPSRRPSSTLNEDEDDDQDLDYQPRGKKQGRRNVRRQLKPKKGVQPPEREKMTIADLIMWNPTENPIKECSDDKETVIGTIVDEPPFDSSEMAEEENLGPQLVVTDDGEIVVDERSLFLNRTHTAPPAPSDPDKFRVGYSRKNTRSSWTKKETLQFYKLLSVVGTDFSLLSHLLPGKTRIQIINKYKLERKKNKNLINKARNLQVFDLNELLTPDHWRSEEEELEEPPPVEEDPPVVVHS